MTISKPPNIQFVAVFVRGFAIGGLSVMGFFLHKNALPGVFFAFQVEQSGMNYLLDQTLQSM
jgi:hypothetical protein